MSFALILLLIVAAVGTVGLGVGVVVVKAASNKQLAAAPAPKQLTADGLADADVLDATVKDLRKGALLEVTGFGDSFEDVQLEVEAYTRYSRERDEWHELQSSYQGRPVAIVWDEERGVLRVWAVKHLRGTALADVGLDLEALEGLAKGATVEGAGETWTLDDAGKAYSHSNGTGFGKEHRSWELLSGDQRKILRIERWGDDLPTVSLGEAMEPDGMTIYRVKGK
ncbi:MAG: DUF4178 domain-containing protein [Planctomycetes bacterium]|nr:DUF4178 domain-containing protein [Planctomycetota bacterium]